MTVNFDVLIILAGLLAHAGLASTIDLNSTLFTAEASDLPAGTYIATGIAGVTQLAEYLDTYPDTRITRLLISDSSIQDVDAKHDHLFTDESKDEIDWDEATHQKVWAAVHDFEEPLNRVLAKAAPTLEALSYLAYIYYSAGLHGVTYPEWTDPRLKPLVQHNYPSLTQFDFPIHHLDGAYRVLTEAYYPPCEKADLTTHHLDNPCYVAHKASRFPSLTHLRTAGIFQSSTLASTLAYVIDKFPRLTHLLVTDVGAMCELPSELYPTLRRLIPDNLTVIAEPALSSRLDEGRDFECGTLSIQYEDFILKSLRDDGVHVKLPIEDDYDTERGRFSLRRAITEFVDRARGGEGEWTLPERVPVREEWCRWRRQCSGYQRDESGL
ncbi:hypothetical protein DFH08DRAFT_863286 [Mycena albidolilacea]|uniref:Uncharacterized protein n=1 Tax=Mycena albidolilacea TaxID=1033008 RepID=A0AAD7ETM1_9AGAR|nr:hypothetical protein DFH08DRAFT_863286 [Mycena albidolilacea]